MTNAMIEMSLDTSIEQGQQYLDQGAVPEAYSIARNLILNHPENIDVLVLNYKIDMRIQQYDSALKYITQAITSASGRLDLQIYLANCYARSSQWHKAIETLDRLSEDGLHSPKILNDVAVVYNFCEHHLQAKKLFEKAYSQDPENEKILYNLSSTERFLGNNDAAEKYADQLIALNPTHSVAIYLRSGLKKQTEDKNHIPFLMETLQKNKSDPGIKIQLSYALAKEYEDLNKWEESFIALDRGAKEKRASFKYDGPQNVKILERTATLFSKTYLDTETPSSLSEAPIFILGLPRTGSTLIDTILSAHHAVHSAGELPDFPNQFGLQLQKAAAHSAVNTKDKLALATKIDFKDLGENYIRVVEGKIGRRIRFTDKLPFNFQYCGIIKRTFPNARIIHTRRDPMDSCYAIYKALFLSPYPYSYDLMELAEYFVSYYRLMDHWRNVLPDQILDVNYEAVVADHEKETRRMIKWCGLDWDPACLDYRTTGNAVTTLSAPQVRRKIYSSSIGKWRHFKKQLSPLRDYLEQHNIPFLK